MTARATSRTPSPKQRVALIDGDFAIYWTAYLSEGESDAQGFLDNLDGVIESWTKKAGCTKAHICLSLFKVKNFRHTLYKDYKKCRKGRELPSFIKEGYDYLAGRGHKHSVIQILGLEADDLMGIAATTENANNEFVIVTVDKDLQTIPGEHWNPRTGATCKVSPMDALRKLYTQWLTGDATDSVPGLPGVGPKKAQKIIDAVTSYKDLNRYERELCRAVQEAYIDAGQKKTYWLTMGRLVKILTSREWDRKKKTFKMWEPPV
jgi:5'-3' exonuclease